MEQQNDGLTDDQERIATRAADIMWERFQLEVGKTTLRLILYLLGAAFIALAAYLGLHEKLTP